MIFTIIVKCFSALWVPALVPHVVYLRWMKKPLLLSLLAKGREGVQCLPWDVLGFIDSSVCIKLRGRIFLPSPVLKADMWVALTGCFLWSCISSVVRLSVYQCLHFCMRHWDTWTSVSCLEVFSVWNFFFFFYHPSCLTHFLDPEFCCCRMLSFSMCQLRL